MHEPTRYAQPMRHLPLLLVIACVGDPPEPQSTTYLRGTLRNLLQGGIADVRVCIAEIDRCTTTDGQGHFLVEQLPEDTDVTVLIDKDGLFPVALPHHTADSEPPWDKTLLTTGLMESQANRADTELDPELGHFTFMVHQAHFSEGKVEQSEGVALRLEPSGGVPYYLTSGLQRADPDLTATTRSGGGGVLNLSPGDYLVHFQAGGPCSRILSWDFAPGEPVPVPILAGRGTYIDVLCPEP
ncbi:MAG: hypothetical protein ACI9MC_000162 [Kiritimatiellia bacterium]|jgi:hypothetical protein